MIAVIIAILFVAAALMAAFSGKADLRTVQIALAVLAALTIVTQIVAAVLARMGIAGTEALLENEELQRVRTLDEAEKGLRKTISEMTSILKNLLGELDQHDSRLDAHRTNVSQAVSLNELYDIEQRLLAELDKISEANAGLRHQVVEMNRKIIDQEVELSKLSRLSTIDPLTLVANRGAFDRRLAEEVDRVTRYQTSFSLIMVDIDHFKHVNDTYGHPNGDRLLRGFGKLIDSRTRLSDFVARFGGEEFVVILPEANLNTAVNVAEKVRQHFSRTNFHLESEKVKLSASFGVSQFRAGDTPETVLKRADDALYLAKRRGRNRTCSEKDLEEAAAEQA